MNRWGSVALVGVFACGGSEGESQNPSTFNPPIVADGGSSSGDGGTPDSGGTGGGAIQGTLLERTSRAPMPGRPMKIRDATGKMIDVASDANGAFSATGIAAPYDLWVSPSGSSPDATSALYLGLRATTLRIFAGDAAVPPITKRTGKIALSFTVPSCTGGACKMNYVARTPDGDQQRGVHPGLGPTVRNDEIIPRWLGGTTTSAQVTVLLTGLDGASHYTATGTANVTEGQTTNLTLSPQPIGTMGAASLTATTTAPASFGPASGIVHLSLPNQGGELEIATGSLASPLAFSVPNMAGSSLRFFVTQLSGAAGFNAVGGVQVGVTPAAAPFSVAVGEAFPLVAPTEGGSISVMNGALEYRASTEPRTRLAQLVRNDGRSIYVWHAEQKLALTRITSLSLPLTPSSAELVTEEHARPLDEFVSDMTLIANDRSAASSIGITVVK